MKVQVMMSEEMVARVDSYAKTMGVSRSALCSMLIGQGIMNYDNVYSMAAEFVDKYGQRVVEVAEKGGVKG